MSLILQMPLDTHLASGTLIRVSGDWTLHLRLRATGVEPCGGRLAPRAPHSFRRMRPLSLSVHTCAVSPRLQGRHTQAADGTLVIATWLAGTKSRVESCGLLKNRYRGNDECERGSLEDGESIPSLTGRGLFFMQNPNSKPSTGRSWLGAATPRQHPNPPSTPRSARAVGHSHLTLFTT